MAKFIISFLFWILFCSVMQSEAVYFNSFANPLLCHPQDALSLLQFKKGMLQLNSSFASDSCDYRGQYAYPKMISWNQTSSDCCTWDGVTCHRITGHVIGLDLSCSRLRGVIHPNSTLFHLSHLINLNIAFNNFSTSEISPNIGALSSLTHLNFSDSYFGGTIPSQLSHLSKLILLDLSDSFWISNLSFNPGDFQILLRNLTHIRVLSLNGVQIPTSSPANWSSSSLTSLALGFTGVDGKLFNSIPHLPLLETLILEGNRNLSVGLQKANCLLDGIPSFICSFASLKHLDLTDCGLSGSFTNSIGNLSHIVQLSLSDNNFTGDISPIILNLPKLTELYLSYNSFSGQFPSCIGNLTELTFLALARNSLSGALPSNMSGLQKLRVLYLSYNEFDGTIPSWVFSLPSLRWVNLGNNRFTGQIKEFISRSLEVVDLADNQLDGPIPSSIFHLVNLSYLHLGSNNLSGYIDLTMISQLKNLAELDLSNNKLSLKIENEINVFFPNLRSLSLASCRITEFPNFLKNSDDLEELDLSNNKLHGQIPNWIPKKSLRFLNISHNSLSGLRSLNTLTLMKNLQVLDLGSNQFQEPLPLSICSLIHLFILDLSHNNFNGSIPECFGNFSIQLEVMNLAKNDLKGAIPRTFRKERCSLEILNLNGNSLEGPLPGSLANCMYLEILDLGNNKINDTFPTFLENLMKLRVLIFKSNRFFGSINNFKNEIFLPKILVFDISRNEFSGALPAEFFKSFKAMATLDQKSEPRATYLETETYRPYVFSVSLVMKGNAVELVKIWTTFVVIDLSSNNFTGDIPETIGNLNLLIALNLSHNKFSGHISSILGKLYFLESLDLSWNQIEGEIPWQLADITNLGFLNVSKNHLRGRIPQGKQFNTFLNDSYYGNSELCGFPVSKDCGEKDLPLPPSGGSYQDDEEDSSFWSAFTWKSVLIGYGFGFAIGCLVVFTSKPKWLARNIEEVHWYALLLLGKMKMYKQLMKNSRWADHRHHRRNN